MQTLSEREERVQLIREMNLHRDWMIRHQKKLEECIVHAHALGMTKARIARIVGTSDDTIRRVLAGVSVRWSFPRSW